jgi:hypothetical protein
MFEDAKRLTGLSYGQLSEEVAKVLDDCDGPDAATLRRMALCPPFPLGSPYWLGAFLHVLGLTWSGALEALGVLFAEDDALVVTEGSHRLIVKADQIERNGVVWLLEMVERWRGNIGE